MARDYYIHGESMVTVKSRADSAIGALSLMGLAQDAIRVTPEFAHKEITLDAWGGEVPAEVQAMLASLTLQINFIHFDRPILDECWRLSMGGAALAGQTSRAGTRLGGGGPLLVAPNNFITMTILSPIAGRPFRFFASYMTGPASEYPLGTEKSVVGTTWKVIPYTQDPWGAGLGATNFPLWDTTAQT